MISSTDIAVLREEAVTVFRSLAGLGLETSEVRESTLGRAGYDVTVLVSMKVGSESTLFLGFERSTALSVAKQMMQNATGEIVSPKGTQEEIELLDGSLGELGNQLANSVASRLGQQREMNYTISSPSFVHDADTQLCAAPLAFFSVEATTARGNFRLGIVDGLASAGEATRPEGLAAVPTRTALVADDSMIVRKKLTKILASEHFEVVAEAVNGQEVLELYREHRPDLVFLDINMPLVEGPDALRMVLAEDPEAAVIMCTAVAQRDTIRKCLKAGAKAYLTKPFDDDKMRRVIRSVFQGKEKTRSRPMPRAISGGTLEDDVRRLGRYEIEALVGRGGMGSVYRGRDPSLDRTVAIKVLARKLAQDPENVERFLNEARAMARISHPNVIQVFYIGSQGAYHYFAMEHLQGSDLEKIVEDRGPLSIRDALGYVRQTALGLAAACEQDLVHLDVKPSNLMLTGDGTLKVTDFGLAKPMDRKSRSSEEEKLVGTPEYMAPERIQGKSGDFRTDIYALGATLFFLLTAHPPFGRRRTTDTLKQHLIAPRPKLPKAPKWLDQIVARMMARDPEERFSSHEELIKSLDHLLRTRRMSRSTSHLRAVVKEPSRSETKDLSMEEVKGASPSGSSAMKPSVQSGEEVKLPLGVVSEKTRTTSDVQGATGKDSGRLIGGKATGMGWFWVIIALTLSALAVLLFLR